MSQLVHTTSKFRLEQAFDGEKNYQNIEWQGTDLVNLRDLLGTLIIWTETDRLESVWKEWLDFTFKNLFDFTRRNKAETGHGGTPLSSQPSGDRGRGRWHLVILRPAWSHWVPGHLCKDTNQRKKEKKVAEHSGNLVPFHKKLLVSKYQSIKHLICTPPQYNIIFMGANIDHKLLSTLILCLGQ